MSNYLSRAVKCLGFAASLSLPGSLQAQPPLPPIAPPAPISTPMGAVPAPAVPATPVPKLMEPSVQPGETIFQVTGPFTKLQLRVLETRVLELGNRIKIVDGFDQTKINVSALSPHRVRLHADQHGVTSLKLIDEYDNVHNLEVFVEPDTRELKAYLDRLFPGTSIEVVGIRDGVVLRGWVTEPSQIPLIMGVAEQFYPIVQPQLTVAGPSQVQLHVKVIEVQRTKLRELGFNFLMTGQQYYLYNGVGSLAPLAGLNPPNNVLPFGGPPMPRVDPLALTQSNLQFAITGNNNIFQGFIHALQTESLAKVLAEPILVTTSGRPATVHSGGEFPVPVPQGFGNLSIEWKEIGVKLEAVPIILGNGRLRLDLAPEVSERDFSNTLTINGALVPGVASRSVNTQVEMSFGETLMIGGLISTRKQGSIHRVPFLGELPWIGAAFSRKSFQTGETELVILVTPQMVSPMQTHQVPAGGPGLNSSDPTMRELFLDGNLELPVFGPECPNGNCPPAYQLMTPPGMSNGIEPVPAVTVRPRPPVRGDIQQTSGERSAGSDKATTADPFRSSFSGSDPRSSREKSTTQSRFSGTGEVSTAEGTKTRSSSAVDRELPGMIEPRSATANRGSSLSN